MLAGIWLKCRFDNGYVSFTCTDAHFYMVYVPCGSLIIFYLVSYSLGCLSNMDNHLEVFKSCCKKEISDVINALFAAMSTDDR